MTHLLLLGCSARKDLCPEPLPARERYTGVFFRVIAKAQREGYWPDGLELAIVSARYGLLLAEGLVPWYEQRLEQERSHEICRAVSVSLDCFLSQRPCDGVCVTMGQRYRQTLANSVVLQQLDRRGTVYWVKGVGTGMMQRQLRDWLYALSHPGEEKAVGFPRAIA